MAWRWAHWTMPMTDYRLYWNNGDLPEKNPKALNLQSMNYTFWMPADSWYMSKMYPGIEKFFTDRDFGHSSEYGKTIALNLAHPNLPNYIAEVAKKRMDSGLGFDGVAFDWWRDEQPNGFSRQQVRNARISIAKAVREALGDEKIILANVMWYHDRDTVGYLSGAFLEFWKDGNESRVYNSSELKKIEKSLDFYNSNLASPKIIALNGHRKTKDLSDQDRNSSENRKMAKLLTAMSVVVPDNGYILYSDGSRDDPNSDLFHLNYDFYSFDIGQPVGPMIQVSSGVRYKEHEGGFIAYNITNSNKMFFRSNGVKVEIFKQAGLFCRDTSSGLDCLSYD